MSDPIMAKTEVDVLVFGASGFTGERICRYLAAVASSSNVTYAICGRSATKLQSVVDSLSDFPNDGDTSVLTFPSTTLIADVTDHQSMVSAFSGCGVVIGCVGPFRFYGEQVVKACLEAKVNYVDICGEPHFLENMQNLYHEEAKALGLTMVGSCGFDSIPADCGTLAMAEEFEKIGAQCHSIESFLIFDGGADGGAVGHYATFESAVHGLSTSNELRALRKSMGLPKPEYVDFAPRRSEPWFKHDKLQMYCFKFPGSDASVVRRSQIYEAAESSQTGAVSSQTPIHYAAYFCVPSLWNSILVSMFGGTVQLLSGFQFGRKMVLDNPTVFTNGTFSHEGPTKKQLLGSNFRMVMYGSGKKQRTDGNESPKVAGYVEVKGPEPGYVATPIMVVESALEVLSMRKSNLAPVGWLTPACAFRGSCLRERLSEKGVEIESKLLAIY